MNLEWLQEYITMDIQSGILADIISNAIKSVFSEFAHQQIHEQSYYQQPTLLANAAFKTPSDYYSTEIHGQVAHQNWAQTSVLQPIVVDSHYHDNYQSHVSASEPVVPYLQDLMPQQDNMEPYYQQSITLASTTFSYNPI
jgi:hypothetical protein